MKAFFALLLLALPLAASAAKNVTLQIDGETYSCISGGGNGASCDCRMESGYVTFYLNNVEAKSWSGTNGTQMAACASHLKGQAVCKGSRVSCTCRAENGYTTMFINGVESRSWSGIGGPQMIACVEFLNQQSYCQ